MCAAILSCRQLYDAPRWAAQPAALRIFPSGFDWIGHHVPIHPTVAWGVLAVAVVAGLAGLVGFWSRLAMAITALAAFYLFGLCQLSGTVVHHHHLVWFATLLAASRCGDALSIDARHKQHPPSVAYALPIWIARTLIAIIFFFPGLWKLRASGWAWIASDNLRNQMWWHWYELGGATPWLRVDHFPLLCRALAFGAVAFELAFPLLLFWRRTRLGAVGLALSFHALAYLLFRIEFSTLWLCYVVFFDWSRSAPAATVVSRRALAPTLAVGAILVAASTVQGWRGATQAWPFACYPTFQWIAPAEIPALLVEGVRTDERVVTIPNPPPSDPRRAHQFWGANWSLGTDPAALRAYWKELHFEARELRAVRFYRAYFSVAPEDRGKPPLRRELLGEIPLSERTGMPRAKSGAITFL